MTILFLLIPLAVVLMGTAVAALLWALREGQFDDLDSPAMQIVLDDESAPPQRRSRGPTAAAESPAEASRAAPARTQADGAAGGAGSRPMQGT